ncbi:hypothetical protein Nepgr_033570 [Nepenthes gracilis]|uniref:Uncharacterized protein n=1 Tax=Nepenthes gracilis TaxID=150966 RepID=A0AAD3Y918_NEPGR|nr:hypothetical protein Nepgr_033570 [Nepenthes gracilis]
MELLKHGQLNGVGAGWPPPDGVYWAINSLSSVEVGPVATLGQPLKAIVIGSGLLFMVGGSGLRPFSCRAPLLMQLLVISAAVG